MVRSDSKHRKNKDQPAKHGVGGGEPAAEVAAAAAAEVAVAGAFTLQVFEEGLRKAWCTDGT